MLGNLRGTPYIALKEGSIPAMVLDYSCIMNHDFSSSLRGRSSLENVESKYIRQDCIKVGRTSGIKENGDASFSYKRLCVRTRREIAIPPGFTPVDKDGKKGEAQCIDELDDQHLSSSKNKNDSGSSKGVTSHRRSDIRFSKAHSGGSILNLIDELVKVGQTIRGILCVWEPDLFVKDNISAPDYFLVIMGTWIPTSTQLLVISVYAPQELTEKRQFLEYLFSMVNIWDGECVILGDFNEVRMEQERFGSYFNYQGAFAFNNFISFQALRYLAHLAHRSTSKDEQKLSDVDKALDQVGFNKATLKYQWEENLIVLHGNPIKKISTCNIRILVGRRVACRTQLDVVAAVSHFFSSGSFPRGCNASFITLIQKIQDAKVVKDFCPISFIGSVYKIIAKVLANRLSLVMSDLISDVQSAFVTNRQILDGPFILNELSSCVFMASSLKINIQKSKLMGFRVHSDKVDSTSRRIGCSTFSTPFNYLSVKVGGANVLKYRFMDEDLIFKEKMESQSETTQTLRALKFPVLKTRDYDLWSMRMDQYLTHTDYALWEVIVNGDAPTIASASAGTEGAIPFKTAEQKLARKNELKAKSTLLLAISDEHILKFHGIKDAKTLWEAIKARFGGNKESKKMQKTILKQQYENFAASRSEGLDKIYDSTNESVNTAHEVFTASLQGQASSSTYADDVMFSFFSNQSNSPQLENEDLEHIDTDDIEEM
ncbi:ribonuclease H-like domain-containing protein, partial [Tanacetum coccineum]